MASVHPHTLAHVLPLPVTSPDDLLRAAHYEIDPVSYGIVPRDPYRLAGAADILIDVKPVVKGHAMAFVAERKILVEQSRNDIFRENCVEETFHILFDHPERSSFTYQRHGNVFEREARTASLLTLATDAEIDFLLRSNAPETLSYFAGRFGMTKRGFWERMDLRGERGLLDDPARQVSGLARWGYCEKCGRRRWLKPHHHTYMRLDQEWAGDGRMLCDDCHQDEHRR